MRIAVLIHKKVQAWKLPFFIVLFLSSVLCVNAAEADQMAVRETVKHHLEQVALHPLEVNGNVWIIYVKYDLSVDALPLLPGAECVYVIDENEDFHVVSDINEMPEEVVDEIFDDIHSTEVLEWFAHIGFKYNDIVADNAEVGDWEKRRAVLRERIPLDRDL